MPNDYIKAEKFVSLALAQLDRDAVLPNVLSRLDGGVFVGAKNDTITVELPGITRARDYEWRTRTAPIVYDEIYRTTFQLGFGSHTTAANAITDEEMAMDVTNFSAEVLTPMLDALTTKLDNKVVKALDKAEFKRNDVDFQATGTNAVTAWDYALQMRSVLNKQGTPKANRKLLVGTDAEVFFLKDPNLVKMDPSTAVGAYREATIGRIAGFDVVSSERVGDDDIFGLHDSWAYLSVVAPPVEQGMVYAARRNYRNWGLRVVRGFDMNYARNQTLLSTFTGINPVKDEYLRYTKAQEAEATAAGAEVGDIVLDEDADGQIRPQLTGKNVRGARGKLITA